MIHTASTVLTMVMKAFGAQARAPWLATGLGSWASPWCPFFGGWAGGWFPLIFGVLFWVLVCVSMILVIRRLLRSSPDDARPSTGSSRAEEILKERYARGEITEEEFHKMLGQIR
ncbi:SHOCT domain-containing protein [Desulfosoma caldarium]|uniref:Putative membrane protein n=1 Tax=Desulfosoma caldarium TaxID=610254 RepID=A0A3N1VKB7_9BACT|nr:SHOCT domain-containing protein [Desulfosoma caldarium]ROR03256.1 putative membrane protein [Desulfosoma caldarium]